MANTFANLTNGAGILKTVFAGPVVSQFNDENPIYREFEKGKEKYQGAQVNRSLKVRRNQGVGAVSDGGNLPNIGKQVTQQAIINVKLNYLRFGITAAILKASQGDKGAFVSLMEYEMSEGLVDLRQSVSRQTFWDGTSDLAVVSANAVASNVISITGRESTENIVYLDVGSAIDIYTSAGVLVASALNVTAITGLNTLAGTITLDSAITTSATDVIVAAGSFNNEIQGMLYTMDGATTGTIYNIDRALYPVYQSNVVSASGGQLNLNLMKQAWNLPKIRAGAKTNAIFCDYNSERFYERLLVADKRYINKVKGDGSFASKDENYLEYSGVPITPDKDCPQRFFFIDSKGWKKYVLSELEWADETGSYMIAQTGTDSWECRLRLFANYFCEKPSGQAVLGSYISP